MPDQRPAEALPPTAPRDVERDNRVVPVLPLRQPQQVAADRMLVLVGGEPGFDRLAGESVTPPGLEAPPGDLGHVRVVLGMPRHAYLVAGCQPVVVGLRVELLDEHGASQQGLRTAGQPSLWVRARCSLASL